MKKVLFISLLFFIISLFLLTYAYVLGEITVALIVIFPLITIQGIYGLIGVFFLIGSFLLTFLLYPMILFQSEKNHFTNEINDYDTKGPTEQKINSGGVIFLGPIPIVFGTNKKITKYMIITSIIILIFILLYASLLLNE